MISSSAVAVQTVATIVWVFLALASLVQSQDKRETPGDNGERVGLGDSDE